MPWGPLPWSGPSVSLGGHCQKDLDAQPQVSKSCPEFALLLGAGPAVQVGAPNKARGLRACKVFLVFNQRRKILVSWETCLEEGDYLFIKRSGLLRMSLPSFLFCCMGRRGGWSEWEDAGLREGKHLRKLAKYWVSSKNCHAAFCAMGDLVSGCSLAFLDPQMSCIWSLLLFFTYGDKKREIKPGGEAVDTDIPMRLVAGEKGTVQVFQRGQYVFLFKDPRGEDKKKKIKKIFVSTGWCFVEH